MRSLLLMFVGSIGLMAQPAPTTISIAGQPLPVVTSLTVIPSGGTGPNQYCYGIVVRYGIGNSQLSQVQCVNVAASGSVAISWQAPSVPVAPASYALAYDVVRFVNATGFPASGTCNCLVLGTTSGLTATDTLGVLSSYTYSTASIIGDNLSVDNTSTTTSLLASTLKLVGPNGVDTLSCQPGLGDGLNTIAAGTYPQTNCRNVGSIITIVGIRCYVDTGSSTLNVTTGGNTSLLTGAITCTNGYATGVQTANVTLASGDYLKFTFVSVDGLTKQTSWVVSYIR